MLKITISHYKITFAALFAPYRGGFLFFKLAVSAVALSHLFCACSYGDTVTTIQGDTLEGVISDEDAENIVIVSDNGARNVRRADIKNTSYDTDVDNLVRLAKDAKDSGDQEKAYYYYQRVFLVDPESPEALEGIAALDPALVSARNGMKFAAKYERFRDKTTANETDKEILRLNAEYTENLMKKFGMILKNIDEITTIEEVLPSSPAERAGLRNSDVLVEINGTDVRYIGKYDAIYLLLNSASAVRLLLEREANIWVSTKERVNIPSFTELTGFAVTSSPQGAVVSNIPEEISRDYGISPGDELIAVASTDVRSMSREELSSFVAGTAPQFIKFKFRKKAVMEQ